MKKEPVDEDYVSFIECLNKVHDIMLEQICTQRANFPEMELNPIHKQDLSYGMPPNFQQLMHEVILNYDNFSEDDSEPIPDEMLEKFEKSPVNPESDQNQQIEKKPVSKVKFARLTQSVVKQRPAKHKSIDLNSEPDTSPEKDSDKSMLTIGPSQRFSTPFRLPENNRSRNA